MEKDEGTDMMSQNTHKRSMAAYVSILSLVPKLETKLHTYEYTHGKKTDYRTCASVNNKIEVK